MGLPKRLDQPFDVRVGQRSIRHRQANEALGVRASGDPLFIENQTYPLGRKSPPRTPGLKDQDAGAVRGVGDKWLPPGFLNASGQAVGIGDPAMKRRTEATGVTVLNGPLGRMKWSDIHRLAVAEP